MTAVSKRDLRSLMWRGTYLLFQGPICGSDKVTIFGLFAAPLMFILGLIIYKNVLIPTFFFLHFFFDISF